MRTFRSALAAGLFLAAAALTGCLFGNSSDDPGAPGEQTASTAYTARGNWIITPAHSDTETYCEDDSLVIDIQEQNLDSVEFEVTATSLKIFPDADTLFESGALVQYIAVFTRVGSGAGLGGLWENTGEEYRVVSGTPSEAEKAEQENDRKRNLLFRAYFHSWARFADGKIVSYADRESARQFVSSWNDEFINDFESDSARFAVTVKAVDKHTVELKGRKTGETVRLTQTMEATTFSSDNPGHALHRYLENPKSCPNEYSPEWYSDFLQANLNEVIPEEASGLPKTAGNRKAARTKATGKGKIRGKIGFLTEIGASPLKTISSLLN
jgi:hypothetical protein